MTVEEFDFSGTFEEWTQGLPLYQRSLLEVMRRNVSSDADLASAWLNASATSGSFPYGAKENLNLYADHFQNALHDVLCSDAPEFEEQRKSLMADAGLGQMAMVTGLSTLLGTTLFVSVPLIAPAVAVTLFFIGFVGKNAWCAMQTERRAGSKTTLD